jgi:hypothetical protein
VHMLPTHT